jgi:hypothetical protein
MIRNPLKSSAMASLLVLTGCVTTTTALAPGAESVRIVRGQADVASCTAVGNVRQPPDQNVDMRNLTVGVGGDTLFVTEELTPITGSANVYTYIKSGVAYRCSK